jgi:hypothetical protein
LIPRRPLATDDFASGLYRRPREVALAMRHIQVNAERWVGWLNFDLDRPAAWDAANDAGIPEPTFVAVNPANGHAHLGYLLASPVPRFDSQRRKPLEFLADVQRGMTKRLDADPSYGGLTVKNPTHSAWRVEWRVGRPYVLAELNADLTSGDKLRVSADREIGEGRNCLLFDRIRIAAYRDVRAHFGDPEGFRRRLLELGTAENRMFQFPLSQREVVSIVRSISKWTLRRFSSDGFSAWQRANVQKRWAGKDTKPWLRLGISERTYYRRRAAGTLERPRPRAWCRRRGGGVRRREP